MNGSDGIRAQKSYDTCKGEGNIPNNLLYFVKLSQFPALEFLSREPDAQVENKS